MKNLFEAMINLLQNHENFAVATVFDKSGSAPRSDGAKMVVRADGSIVGTIGGGRLEAETIELARESISLKRTLVHTFNMTSRDAAGTDMICGGRGEILIDFIDSGDENNLKIFAEAVEILESKEKGWLINILGQPAEKGGINRQRCLVKPDHTMIGNITCDPFLLEKMIAGPAKITIHSEIYSDQRFLVEPLRQGGTVYIFGGGHISQKVAPLCESVGFKTVVLDDRKDYANRGRFPEPVEIMVIPSLEKLPDLEIDEDSYLVIVTRGHLFDRHVLEQVVGTRAGYIGMIGSRRKRDLLYRAMEDNGFTPEELARVHCPIGTDIKAETPEEIAISIAGELVKVRAEKNSIPKEEKAGLSAACCQSLEK